MVADKNGNLVKGKTFILFRYLRFIAFPFEYVPRYKFRWGEAKPLSEIPQDKQGFIMRIGSVINNTIVSFLRIELTNKHKHQHSYRFVFRSLETGEKRGAAKNADTVQNVKLDIETSTLVIMQNPAKAQFTDGGDAEWYNELEASFQGVFTEIMRNTVFADLKEICGTSIGNKLVSNVEPLARAPKTNNQKDPGYNPIFLDGNSKRKDFITVIERINYEMLIAKNLGVRIEAPSILNFDVAEESKEFVTAVEKQAISEVNLRTAKNNAGALNETLQVKKNFIVSVAAANVKATRAIKLTPDATVIGKAAEMRQAPNLRVYVEGGTTPQAATGSIDVNKLIETTLGLDIAQEINDESSKKPKGGKNAA